MNIRIISYYELGIVEQIQNLWRQRHVKLFANDFHERKSRKIGLM